MAKRRKVSEYIPKKPKKKYHYTEEQKLIKRVNQRLVRLERSGIDSYAKRLLEERLRDLNAWTSKGRARTSVPEFNEIEKRKFIKALKLFDKSESATVKGARNIKQTFKEKLKKDISMSDAYAIQTMFEIEDLEEFIRRFDPSEFWNFISEASREGWAEQSFIEKFIENFDVTDDLDIRLKLKHIYDEYVS